jgi:3-ketoacyl-CoA synthase
VFAGIKPEQVDILITNCSIFCPTPSLASMLINKFKFRRDIQSYNLGGMGCSIGVIAIGLVRDMLQVSERAVAPELNTQPVSGGSLSYRPAALWPSLSTNNVLQLEK